MAEDAKRSVGAPSLDGALGSLTWQGQAAHIGAWGWLALRALPPFDSMIL